MKSNKGQTQNLNAIEQIRDIVFGREMATYEERFSKTEKDFADQIERLRQDLAESKSVAQDRLEHERDGLTEQIADLGKSLEDLKKTFLSFKKETEAKMSGLNTSSLSRKDFSEALLEMSFRFTDGGEGTKNKKSSSSETLPN